MNKASGTKAVPAYEATVVESEQAPVHLRAGRDVRLNSKH